jgi:hypothetical protein
MQLIDYGRIVQLEFGNVEEDLATVRGFQVALPKYVKTKTEIHTLINTRFLQ